MSKICKNCIYNYPYHNISVCTKCAPRVNDDYTSCEDYIPAIRNAFNTHKPYLALITTKDNLSRYCLVTNNEHYNKISRELFYELADYYEIKIIGGGEKIKEIK